MIWVTSETQSPISKQPGSRDVAAASVVSVLLMATERNRWERLPSPLLPPSFSSKTYKTFPSPKEECGIMKIEVLILATTVYYPKLWDCTSHWLLTPPVRPPRV
ncbi:uncharacterized protein LOC144381330 [Halichoerus grypus]